MATHIKLINPAYAGVKNIIFDYGGVIIDLHFDRTQKAFEELGITDMPNLMDKLKEGDTFSQFEIGALGAEAFLNHLLALLPGNLKDDGDAVYRIVSAWNAMVGEVPVARIELLTKLKNTYKTYLLSNTNTLHIAAVDRYLKQVHKVDSISPYFHKAYYSYDIGLRKPNANAFEFVLAENNLKAAETLFIDDNEHNIEAAKALGLLTYHIQSPAEDVLELFA